MVISKKIKYSLTGLVIGFLLTFGLPYIGKILFNNDFLASIINIYPYYRFCIIFKRYFDQPFCAYYLSLIVTPLLGFLIGFFIGLIRKKLGNYK